MKFTLGWLKDHLETEASIDEIATALSAIGLEVDGIDDPGEALCAFTVARVKEAARHPDADKLQVLQVEIAPGKPTLEVVWGRRTRALACWVCSRRSALMCRAST